MPMNDMVIDGPVLIKALPDFPCAMLLHGDASIQVTWSQESYGKVVSFRWYGPPDGRVTVLKSLLFPADGAIKVEADRITGMPWPVFIVAEDDTTYTCVRNEGRIDRSEDTIRALPDVDMTRAGLSPISFAEFLLKIDEALAQSDDAHQQCMILVSRDELYTIQAGVRAFTPLGKGFEQTYDGLIYKGALFVIRYAADARGVVVVVPHRRGWKSIPLDGIKFDAE